MPFIIGNGEYMYMNKYCKKILQCVKTEQET